MLADTEARELMARAYCGRLATMDRDGLPYIVPLLHVFIGDEISLHNTAVRGHLRANVERDGRARFEVDEPVKVFDYGRFECDTGLAYQSALAYGRVRKGRPTRECSGSARSRPFANRVRQGYAGSIPHVDLRAKSGQTVGG